MSWRLKRRLKLQRREQDELERAWWMDARRAYDGDLTVSLEKHVLGDRRGWVHRWWIRDLEIPADL